MSGRRVVNEKLPYNELAQSVLPLGRHGTGAYPDLVLVQIWDQRSQDHCASDEYGRLIVPPGADDSHVIRGDTLDELADASPPGWTRCRRRHRRAAARPRLPRRRCRDASRASTAFAAAGVDEDFHRGETAGPAAVQRPVKEEPGRTNPTMWPLADDRPVLRGARHRRHARHQGRPAHQPRRAGPRRPRPTRSPGSYGVGNCVASASAQAYWAGGATLGPIIAFAYRAAAADAAERDPPSPPPADRRTRWP